MSNRITLDENIIAVWDIDAIDGAGADEGVDYSISGADAGLFSIGADNGMITFLSAPDFENPQDNDTDNAYVIDVTATDAAGNVTTQSVVVSVMNVIEVGETFTIGDLNYKVSSIDPSTAEVMNSPSASGDIIIPESVSYEMIDFTVTSIGEVAFQLNSAVTGVTLPSTITAIKGRAFFGCSLSEIDLPEGLTVLSELSFSSNDLQSVIIPESVTRIEVSAFEGNQLQSLVLPTGVEEVQFLSFAANPITSLRLPTTLTTLSVSAFEDNTILTEVIAEYTTPPVLQDGDLSPFKRVDISLVTLKIPEGTLSNYETATVWQDFGTILEVDLRAPIFTSAATIDYAENGAGVAYTVTADETATFILGTSKDESLFTLANDSEISFVSAPDFEIPQDSNGDNVYAIDVVATDVVGNTSTTEIQITVTDVDEIAPVFTSAATASYAENGTGVAYTITADEIAIFALGINKDESLFALANDSEISFVNAPDFENPQDANGDNVYTIDVIATDVAGNSATLEVTITITDVSQSQTITFEAIESKQYGEAAFSIAASASSGLAVELAVASGPITLSGNMVTITGTGTASITATQAGGNDFGAANPTTVTFEIAKAPLTVTAEDVSITENDALPALTFRYAGFVNDEDESVLDTEPTISTAGVAGTAGEYVITLSGGVDDNYDFTLVNGTLIIEEVLGLIESQLTVYPN
ncbi:MAG: leucine-rich repeat protein, partial [Bacteroidota bacterium]